MTGSGAPAGDAISPGGQPAGRPPAPPSIHVRAVLTWLAIFPLVSITSMATEPLVGTWHPIARACVVTLVVVQLAVYLVVPNLVKLWAHPPPLNAPASAPLPVARL
ncbi:hypothetical protein [Pseudoclavibacter helvolus]|uniref:Antibiotic biosynthesis monooxygenase (ABM) superfamily enzyme n=1 Tax=Pseudoclavibacter helvolus TaxID=255205 RepID=A0A7W4UQX5_9MICO|nr:hypothetical protein [Pseudoclavibacter helvolus]MBB2958987.1 antibiotic biosynthesis monooxygenase (ABM) superfamily enzyme [Pseudoclavibacter helvolus]